MIETKSCKRCQASFACGAKMNTCWCHALPPLRSIPKEFVDCLCPNCLADFAKVEKPVSKPTHLRLNVDYYLEDGFLVFTKAYHLARGYCCESKCRHCPYL